MKGLLSFRDAFLRSQTLCRLLFSQKKPRRFERKRNIPLPPRQNRSNHNNHNHNHNLHSFFFFFSTLLRVFTSLFFCSYSKKERGEGKNHSPSIVFIILVLLVGHRGQFSKLWIVEAESGELLLVDGLDEVCVDRRQRRILLRELRVEIQNILLIFLQDKRTGTWC